MQRCADVSIYPACFQGLVISRRDFVSAGVLFYEALSGQAAEPYAPVPFTDIGADDTDILKAYELKIVDSYGDVKYYPNNTLRRD